MISPLVCCICLPLSPQVFFSYSTISSDFPIYYLVPFHSAVSSQTMGIFPHHYAACCPSWSPLLQLRIHVSHAAAVMSITLDSRKGSNKSHVLWPIHGREHHHVTDIIQVALPFLRECFQKATLDQLISSRFRCNDRQGNNDTFHVEMNGFSYLGHIRPSAIGGDHHLVGMFPPNVQLCEDFVAIHTDLQWPINEHRDLMPMLVSKNGWRGLGTLQFGESNGIFLLSWLRVQI